MSDGASGQYKNRKNFINLTYHMEDFKVAAEWHFFPTSHGKGLCDGIGGTLKRLASRASPQSEKKIFYLFQLVVFWYVKIIKLI
ncbi:hypothetical protein ALC56_06707 [Trachymyrmex septentrionalis]|uniref:Uncharacterized protein n=1 Tax=Trachymyrmex septentrionalis TaxID=34720 RepID=A0A151JX02_9HYME|nr:hypothetical protein ALC56_06707 [Trachymyrmex septentrionalis]